MAKKKGKSDEGPPLPSTSSLIICRNKHWRYISSFHGPWLQLPPEILDSLAHQNWTMPAPRLIDPSVFYDVVKIRKAVDQASEDSVRASAGLSNAAMSGRMDPYGAAGGAGSQLSKERIFKIRQKAVKLLSKAFQLDEVAASVATMQATSTVEDVAQHVLKREPHNTDATYVHFFQEKIPSRAMESHTPLEPLSEIVQALPMEEQPAPLRTRALVQIFKQQWHGAVWDLTMALRIIESMKRMHKPDRQELELASKMRAEQESWQKGHRDWRSVPHLKDEDQPKSLEMQILFNRAGAYLTIACQGVHVALDGLQEYQEASGKSEPDGMNTKAHEERLAARKTVKVNAKRALKDYEAFLSHLDYTPGLPFEFTNEIMQRMYDLASGNKTQTAPSNGKLVELNDLGDDFSRESANETSATVSISLTKRQGNRPDLFERSENGWPHLPAPKIYSASALFAPQAPADLPPFPSEETINAMRNSDVLHEAFGSREAVTYHPLLTDALHSLLLAHALLQTSPTEILRHAHNAARLARIADGYPIFQAARSPARADWIEVLRRANNWLGLSVSWQKLCAPAPLPEAAGGWAKDNPSQAVTNGREAKQETAEQKRERIKQESIIDALSDDRVVDEESFQRAVRAREQRAMADDEGISVRDKDAAMSPSTRASTPVTNTNSSVPPSKRWTQDGHGKEYPISSERAEAIARWIKESPLSMGAKKRKKRPASRKTGQNGVQNMASGMSALKVGDEGYEDGPD